ncbi:Hypothetical protein LDBND_1231 [Lactobacillus delbrueckii subsp. bulgaricus ND02]|nr:Hypothetical protein LDBND_1231 [Lactobacillus delbrueckii subsp. bulgaricus ND02]
MLGQSLAILRSTSTKGGEDMSEQTIKRLVKASNAFTAKKSWLSKDSQQL